MDLTQQDKKPEQPQIEEVDEKAMSRKSDFALIFTIAVIIIMIAAVIFIPRFFSQKEDLTIDEMHQKNFEGKLNPELGYLHDGLYSFVFYDGLWYTQLSTEKKLFNIPFHYNPDEVKDIPITGALNYSYLERYHTYYNTFDPTDEFLNYVAVSTGESNGVLINAFGKGVIAACARNETEACHNRPIVDCETTKVPTFYFASEEETNVIFLNTCIIVSGQEEELLRATDRMLFHLLQIMP